MVQSGTGRRSIFIRTRAVRSETVCCVIEDSGPGIDTTHLPHLFDSFFTTKDTGMGIGLSICRSIIEAHDGHIEADNMSALGGARFSFALPRIGLRQVETLQRSQRSGVIAAVAFDLKGRTPFVST